MSLPYNSAAFDTHKCTGGIVEYPFHHAGDRNTKLYIHYMCGNRSTYSPLTFNDEMTSADEKPSGSPFSDDSAAYYVGDRNLIDRNDGTVIYERMFANVPDPRIEPFGFYAFEFPKMATVTFSKNTSNRSFYYQNGWTHPGPDAYRLRFIMTFSNNTNFSVGDSVTIYNSAGWKTQDQSANSIVYVYSYNATIRSISGNTFTAWSNSIYYWVDSFGRARPYYILEENTGTTSYTMSKVVPGRTETWQADSPSIADLRYIKVGDPTTIALNSSFNLLDSSGNQTDELDTTTTPLTISQYRSHLTAGDYVINAEPESIRRWMGNIYEVAAIKIQPQ
jgi:hypothetical protein